MPADPWLGRWLPLIAQRAGDAPILELGCGPGHDTEVLCQAGHRVVAIDLSAAAIAQARARVPAAQIYCQDIRAPFPVADRAVHVVVASLSLHYFVWPETMALQARIHRALAPGGLLLCRLNSTNDHHYGATGYPMIEPNYHLVHGEPKRFFDRAAVERLFASGWTWRSVQEQVIDRYEHPKAVWEVVLDADTGEPGG